MVKLKELLKIVYDDKKKKFQDKKYELTHRSLTMPTEQKRKELKKVNEELQHYEDAIVRRKPGPKVKELVQKYDTPKKK